MKFYLMIRINNHDWKCLHRGTKDECMNKGMELDDTSDWMVCQEFRYSSGRETFSLV